MGYRAWNAYEDLAAEEARSRPLIVRLGRALFAAIVVGAPVAAYFWARFH
jgi:hypothetical protein